MNHSIAIPADGRHAYILSAFREGRSIGENVKAQRHLIGILAADMVTGAWDAIHYCDGAYMGEEEESVLVLCSSGDIGHIRNIRNIARMFDQDSVLRISRRGGGVLYFCDDRDPQPIGQYQACQPGTVEAWTRIRATGEAFTFV